MKFSIKGFLLELSMEKGKKSEKKILAKREGGEKM